MSAYKDKDARINGIKDQIRVVPNFPKPGFFFLFPISFASFVWFVGK